MEKRKIEIGDRFKYNTSVDHYHVWEFIGPEPNDLVVVETYNGRSIGYRFHKKDIFDADNYTYLGNFGKSDNFTELYNLMNESN